MLPGPAYISNVWTQGLFHVSLQRDGASSSWLLIGIENVRYLPKHVFRDSKERSPNTGVSNGPSEPRVAAITGHRPVFTAAGHFQRRPAGASLLQQQERRMYEKASRRSLDLRAISGFSLWFSF